MDLELGGKVVFVTGASGGIGRPLVEAFVDEGARVVAYALDGVPSHEACASFTGDVRDPAALGAAMDAAVTRWGRVDACVTCAGIWPSEPVPLHHQAEERIREVLEVNLFGVIWAARAFLRALSRTGPRGDGRGASLVLIGSTAGRFGERGHAEYSVSKAAMLGLLRSLKNEIVGVDPHGRVNLVEPGWTMTPMVAASLAHGGAVEEATRTMPLRRLATPDDIARAVLFFTSPALARHVTGEALTVAGGMEGRVLW